MKKIVIATALIFSIALVGLQIYVRSDAFSARIRPYVTEPLTKALGPAVRIGKIKASLVPLYVEVRDAALVDDRGRDFVVIRKLRAYINPFALLVNKISLPSIVILEPRLRIERLKNGEVNLARSSARIRSSFSQAETAGPSRYQLQLRGITVKRGRILFTDQGSSSTVSVSDIRMSARVRLSDMSMRLSIKSADVSVAAAAYPEIALRLRASVHSGRSGIRIDALSLDSDDAVFSASGSIGSLPSGRLDLKLRSRVGPRVLGTFADILRRVRGRESPGPFLDVAADVKGNMTDPVVNGGLTLQGLAFKDMRLENGDLTFAYGNRTLTAGGKKWTLVRGAKRVAIDGIDASFTYRAAGVDINRLIIAAGDLEARMLGRADAASGFDAVLSLESSGSEKTLSSLTGAALEGRVGIKGVLTGPLVSPLFDGVLSAWPLTVRGVRFDDIGGKLRYGGRRLSLSDVDIRQQSSRYMLEGFISFSGAEPVYEAQLTVMHSEVMSIVNMFYRPLPLTLAASGRLSLSGKGRDFHAGGRLDLDRGTAYGEAFDKGAVSVSLTRDKISFPNVILYKGSGMVRASGWIGFNKTYSASLESRFVDLAELNLLSGLPFAGQFKLDIDSSGSFSAPAVRVSLAVPALSYYQSPLGGLTAQGEIKNATADFTAALTGDRAKAAGRMELRAPYDWSVRAEVRSDGIDPFVVLGKKDLFGRARVTADGGVNLNGRGRDPSRLSGSATLRRLSISVGDYRIDNEAEQNLEIAAGRLSFSPLSFAGPGTGITVQGSARIGKSVDLAFTGRTNLSLFRVLYAEVEHSDGEAEVKLAVTDDWSNPEVTGELRIKNGEVKVKDVPQKFTALNGTIAFDRERVVAEDLTGEVGGGAVRVTGNAQLAGLALREFASRVTFDNVTTRYPEGLASTLSGELSYDGDAAEQSLSGEVQIKRARYDKRVEWKSMLVDMSRGFYQRKKTDVKWIGDTKLNIHFFGKDNIVFQNNLAKLPLEMDLFIRGTVNQPQLLGRIEARSGTVYFRKNDFKILHGSADFFDPGRMNPALDIQAETRVREYQIRLSVSGTADRATVTMISDPSLSDISILSLLALGKTSEEITGKESGVGVGEAASFATGQFQDIFERRARSLTGLDRFQVDPYVSKSDTAVPRITVGKEVVRDKLYVTYSSNVGATTPEEIFRIEYILNKNFSLVGERNEIGNIGADVKFRFEFK